MHNSDSILSNITPDIFLKKYWQQKPLLIPDAITDYSCPISADEMAGLACESEVESRIILEHDGDYPWQCKHGPFEEVIFSKLPETHWTLLLQSCNLHVPAFAQLLEQFRFIPDWRVDDIMVSYAAPGGSVGPHTDNYDVFLLQAQGKRHWSISTKVSNEGDFEADIDLKILKSFQSEESWELKAGDMLYLPPGVAHHGVADSDAASGDCITISIGFRAPDTKELVAALLDEILSRHDLKSDSHFYSDPNLPLQENPGEITPWALQRISKLVQQELNIQLQDSDWFGRYITRNSNQLVDPEETMIVEMTLDQCLEPLRSGQQLIRNEASKMAFILRDNESCGDNVLVRFYCNGDVEHFPLAFLNVVSIVCNNRHLTKELFFDQGETGLENIDVQIFLCKLINQGHLYYEQDSDVG